MSFISRDVWEEALLTNEPEKVRPIVQNEAFHLQQLLDSSGWAIIRDEALSRMITANSQLIATDEPQRIRDLQSNVRSLLFLLKFPVQMQELARRVNAEAQDNPDAAAQESAPA